MRHNDRALPEDHERNYPGFSAASEDSWDEKTEDQEFGSLEGISD
jgi:hypothetical protein